MKRDFVMMDQTIISAGALAMRKAVKISAKGVEVELWFMELWLPMGTYD